jgi:hypothetical protein
MADEADTPDMSNLETLVITLDYPAAYRDDVTRLVKELVHTLGSSRRLVSSRIQRVMSLDEPPPNDMTRTTSSGGQVSTDDLY